MAPARRWRQSRYRRHGPRILVLVGARHRSDAGGERHGGPAHRHRQGRTRGCPVGVWRWRPDRFGSEPGPGISEPELCSPRLSDRQLPAFRRLSGAGHPAVWGVVLGQRRDLAIPWHESQKLQPVLRRQPDPARGGADHAVKLLSRERSVDRTVATTIQRRWRWAALAGLVVFLVL